jgi:hypothetical protein
MGMACAALNGLDELQKVSCVGGCGDAGAWTWVGGSDTPDSGGSYGTQGMAASTNAPPGRDGASSWVDSFGNFWLFAGESGGTAYGESGGRPGTNGASLFNDVWKYSSGKWTWVSPASPAMNQLGTSAAPGARSNAVACSDVSGNAWVFGGYGYGAGYTVAGSLNDLWNYTASGWQSIQTAGLNEKGSYYETAGSPPWPGSRFGGVCWTDTNRHFWMFGGYGYDVYGNQSYLNDVWEYSTEWHYVAGSGVGNTRGSYGDAGTPQPGGRWDAVSWTDAHGNFWMFGGYGEDSQGNVGELDDLWVYASGAWSWKGGSNVVNAAPDASAGQIAPTARQGSTTWSDASGNLWLFGGYGYGSAGGVGFLDDLWKYDIGAGLWTQVSGASMKVNQPGVYVSEGAPSPANVPGARVGAAGWVDSNETLWLFGGQEFGNTPEYDDLWTYSPGAAPP